MGRTWELITGRKSRGRRRVWLLWGLLADKPQPQRLQAQQRHRGLGPAEPSWEPAFLARPRSPSSIETPWPRGSPTAQRFLEDPPRSQHSHRVNIDYGACSHSHLLS